MGYFFRLNLLRKQQEMCSKKIGLFFKSDFFYRNGFS